MPRPRKPLKTTSPSGPRTAVVYARVSTREQAEEGWSVDAQLALFRTYAAARGFTIAAEFVELESAKETGRPVFKRMVDRARAGDVDAIISEKVDRLYRNMRDPLVVAELGVELHFVKEGMVLTNQSRSSDRFMHDIRLVVAKNYCDNLSEEASKGQREKARQGIWPVLAPIGYVNVAEGHKRGIAVDVERAALVAQLFGLYASGSYSIKGLVQAAKDMGLRTRRGVELKHSAVHLMLQNRLYIGFIDWKGEEFEGKHAPIVDRATFDRVQDVLNGRSGNAGFGKRDYIYRGLFRCARCGCLMSPSTAKGKYVYYSCSGFKGCRRDAIAEDVITAAVVEQIQGLAIRPAVLEGLKQEFKSCLDELRENTEPRIQAIHREQTRIRGRLDQIYNDKLDGVIDLATYQRHRERYNAELAELDRALSAIGVADQAYYDETIAMTEAAATCFQTYELASNAEKREMLQYLLSNSEIGDGQVRLNFKSWFETILEVNRLMAINGGTDTDLREWSG